MPGEQEILDKIRPRVHLPQGSGVALGIGDDCAIFRPRGSREDLLFTTDLLVENVHFLRETHSPEAVGYKALARGLSDIAAMGGEARFCLLSLAAAPWTTPAWIDRFFRGLLRLTRQASTPLAGGDLGRAAVLACDIVVCGAVPRGTALRRDGARPGDHVYVSGRLGGSAHGLETRRGAAWRRHLRPQPRLGLGRFLRRLGVSAAMDLSDGLSLDLRRLCLASGVSARIGRPPIFRGASAEQALHGGEDYELLFTAPPGKRVPPRWKDLPLTRIGTIHKGSPGSVFLEDQPLAPLGYDHFRNL